MSKLRIIKYFRGPSFLASEWTARNPYLQGGEVGYELSGGVVTAFKVGPGYWNDLDYQGGEVYSYLDVVTNPIGDASGVLAGLTTAEILFKMLNPYQVPLFDNIRNDAAGGYLEIANREIGQAVNGPVSVIYDISNPANLSGATPINAEAGGVFSNEGNFANSGNISLSLAAPLNPTIPTTITITLKATHLNGQTSGVGHTTQITFRPKVMWLSSALSSIADGATFMGLSGRQTILSDTYKLTYEFTGTGHAWIAVPAMLNPLNMFFTNVYNPDLPSAVDMQAAGVISINNGVGTYNYNMFRSTYSLLNPIKLKIS